MLRLNVPSGLLTALQLRLVAKIASEQGSAFCDLTGRQTLQLYGIPDPQREAVLQSLESAGLRAATEVLAVPSEVRDLIGVYEQEQPDLFFIGIPILAGRIDAAQMKKAADIAERYADGAVVLTPGQNLLLRGVGKDRVAQVMEGLESVGLKVKASGIARSIRPCPAGGEDPQVVQKVLGIVEYLDRRVLLDEPIRIYLGSCAEDCPDCAAAQIRLRECRMELNGQMIEAYDLSVGGHRIGLMLPAAQAPRRLEQLLIAYKRLRKSDEMFSGFCGRIGDAAVVELLSDRDLEIRSGAASASRSRQTEDVPAQPRP